MQIKFQCLKVPSENFMRTIHLLGNLLKNTGKGGTKQKKGQKRGKAGRPAKLGQFGRYVLYIMHVNSNSKDSKF